MARKPIQKNRTKKDDPTKRQQEMERLRLEIEEREWNVSWWGKLVKLAPLISIIGFGIWYGVQWKMQIKQQGLETERQYKETITNLKRELASDNSAIRIGAALALAEYPGEAIPVMIYSLGAIDPSTKEEDTAFTNAVKTSLKQIGKDAIVPLVGELRRIQKEVKGIFPEYGRLLDLPLSKLTLQELRRYFYERIYNQNLSVYTLLNKSPEDVRNRLKAFSKSIEKELSLEDGYAASLRDINRHIRLVLSEEEINSIVTKLSSMPQLKVAHKNTIEVFIYLLRHHHIEGLDLSDLDLAGACLTHANLVSAKLNFANLTDTDLSDANLSGASIHQANLSGTVLGGANLASTDLLLAYLYEVKGFRDIKDFTRVNLRAVLGLSKEDLEYAKSKGAITD